MRALFSRNQLSKRKFHAAAVSRLTASLTASNEYINDTLRYELRLLRARAREQAQNNPFVVRFIQMVEENVCGPDPFKLQASIKRKNGKHDKNANNLIETHWTEWGKHADITTRWSWNTLQRLIVRTLATDGEVLIRKYKGKRKEYGPQGYQLQLIDIDRLDETKNEKLPGGGAIHMGVQVDGLNRPVAYHILKQKPSQLLRSYQKEYEVIPANEIIHLYVPQFVEQLRGIPWVYAALINLNNIKGFEEAAIIAARIGASDMGFITSPDSGESLVFDGEDSAGNPQIDAEPGAFPVLPPGYSVDSWNPRYPDAAIDPFLKATVRGVAMGLGVAYHNLSGDMTSVNYSSARIAELGERDHWKCVQNFTSEHLHQRIFDDWVEHQALVGMLSIPLLAVDRYKQVKWQGRRWQWVDPQKEVNAKIAAVDNKFTSRTRVIAEEGNDISDIYSELEAEQELAEEHNLTAVTPQNNNSNEGDSNNEEQETDAENTD